MEVFLFYVNAIVGMDDWVDRKLIFKVDDYKEEIGKITVKVDTESPTDFRKLNPGKSYAFQFEHKDGTKELKYYALRAFELAPPQKGSNTYETVLYVNKIEA
jgi:hypothetical protein